MTNNLTTTNQKVFLCVGFVGYLLSVIGCVIFCAYSFIELENVDIDSANDLIRQWSLPFITDIKVVQAHESCDKQWENDDQTVELFPSIWRGQTSVWYETRNVIGEGEKTTFYQEDKTTKEKNGGTKRIFIPGFPMVQQTIYGGKKICGKHQSKEAWDDGHEDAYPGYEGVVQPNDKGECSRPNFKLCPYESLKNPTIEVCIR